MIQDKQKRFHHALNRMSEGLSQLPRSGWGFISKSYPAQDGRECILATGNTAAKKEQLIGGGVSLEPATKNLVEVCSVAERAVLDGAALSVSAISTGEMDGRNNQKYGSGRVARNSLLWLGTRMRNSERQIRLGDRSRYVGMSDIAKMLDCPRAALAGQALHYLNTGALTEALKRQITFHRGHWFETGVHQALVQDAACLPCLNWKSRSDMEMCPSRPIWISRW